MNAKLADLVKEYKANKAANLSVVADVENPIKREALVDRYLLIGLDVAGILEWNGVFEADEDKTAPLTESKIDELFSNFWAVAVISIADCRSCWKRKKTPSRPSQMALRRRAKLLQRMRRRRKPLLVPQMPLYRNSLKNRGRLSGLGDFAQTFRTGFDTSA